MRALAANVPGLAETFTKAFKESKDRAKSYAHNAPLAANETPAQHLLKVRVLTLFRPKYGLSLDLLLLVAGGLFFGGWGYAVSFVISAGLVAYWARNGSRLIPLGFLEFLGNALGYGVGITSPTGKAASKYPANTDTRNSPQSQPRTPTSLPDWEKQKAN